MRLAEYIEALRSAAPTVPVTFDPAFYGDQYPGPLCSWRGRYDELTIQHSPTVSTAGELLADAIKADGGTFGGYKGGDYKMTGHTPVWCDDYGDCYYNAVGSVKVHGGGVQIVVMNVGDYA